MANLLEKSRNYPGSFGRRKLGDELYICNDALSYSASSRNGVTKSVRNMRILKSLRSGLTQLKNCPLGSTPMTFITLMRLGLSNREGYYEK